MSFALSLHRMLTSLSPCLLLRCFSRKLRSLKSLLHFGKPHLARPLSSFSAFESVQSRFACSSAAVSSYALAAALPASSSVCDRRAQDSLNDTFRSILEENGSAAHTSAGSTGPLFFSRIESVESSSSSSSPRCRRLLPLCSSPSSSFLSLFSSSSSHASSSSFPLPSIEPPPLLPAVSPPSSPSPATGCCFFSSNTSSSSSFFDTPPPGAAVSSASPVTIITSSASFFSPLAFSSMGEGLPNSSLVGPVVSSAAAVVI
mmetsp:Transcript_14245/g.18984  ORF Transcript_14245/g.18984 Transcript_14245/m.18984 type:complete len:259 (-) Transcript_14245:1293-2069(-)